MILSLALSLLILFEVGVKRQLTSLITEELRRLSEVAVIDAVDTLLDEDPHLFDHLITLHDTAGAVQAITTDPASINRIKTSISRLAQQNLDSSCRSDGVEVPLGGLTGLVLLADTGPRIHLRVDSRQTVRCAFKSTFESAGINQTLHHILLNAHTEITVYNPYRIGGTIECDTSFEIAQTVIVGSVPSYSGVVTY